MKRELSKVGNMQFGKEKRMLTTYNIAEAIIRIFEPCVGQRNAISKSALYKKLFNKPFEDSLADFVRWDFTKRAMHLLRQQSNCFVISERREDDWYLFVVSSDAEVQVYVNTLENSIKKMRSMMKRAQQAVDQRWHQKTWVLSGRKGRQAITENL